MVKKTITYVNPITDEPVTEEHYFHLPKAALVEMEMEEHKAEYTDKNGTKLTGAAAYLQRMVEAEDGRALYKEINEFLRRAYGKKDGDKFVRSPAIWAAFEGSEAHSELIFDLFTHPEEMGQFMQSIFPGNLEQISAEVSAIAEAERAKGVTPEPEVAAAEGPDDPTGLTNPITPQMLTQAEVAAMDPVELKSGLAEGRYKLS